MAGAATPRASARIMTAIAQTGGAVPGTSQAGRYALAIFDFDGTLADSGTWFLSVSGQLAQRFGFRAIAPEEVETLRGLTSREFIHYLRVPRWKLPAISRYIRRLLAAQIDQIALFEGMGPLLEALASAGVRLAIVTSNSEANVRAVLGPANAARIEQFECGVSLFGKAGRFKRVLRRSGLARADIISIGDETRDITAARKVGVTASAVLWGYANGEVIRRLQPDIIFEKPDDIAELLLAK